MVLKVEQFNLKASGNSAIPSTWEAEAGGFLLYRMSSRTARATQINPVSKKKIVHPDIFFICGRPGSMLWLEGPLG